MNYEKVVVERTQDDKLACERWTFICLHESELCLTHYERMARATRRHHFKLQGKAYDVYENRRYGNHLELSEVPFDDAVRAEAVAELVKRAESTVVYKEFRR